LFLGNLGSRLFKGETWKREPTSGRPGKKGLKRSSVGILGIGLALEVRCNKVRAVHSFFLGGERIQCNSILCMRINGGYKEEPTSGRARGW
jgi:hypothetical protein